MPPERISVEDARRIGAALGIDWSTAEFDAEELRLALEFELHRAPRGPASDVDELGAFKTAVEHLEEHPDHYMALRQLDDEAREKLEGEARSYSESL